MAPEGEVGVLLAHLKAAYALLRDLEVQLDLLRDGDRLHLVIGEMNALVLVTEKLKRQAPGRER